MTILPKYGGAIHPHKTDVNDILCENGKRYRNIQGNVMYHHLVRVYVDDYAKQVNRKGKTHISKSIVDTIRLAKPPGRFLKMDKKDGFFYEIGDRKAYVKTAQLLRDLVLANKKRGIENRASHADNNSDVVNPACQEGAPSISYARQGQFNSTSLLLPARSYVPPACQAEVNSVLYYTRQGQVNPTGVLLPGTSYVPPSCQKGAPSALCARQGQANSSSLLLPGRSHLPACQAGAPSIFCARHGQDYTAV